MKRGCIRQSGSTQYTTNHAHTVGDATKLLNLCPVPVVIYSSFTAAMDTVGWLYSLPETTSEKLHIFKVPPHTCIEV